MSTHIVPEQRPASNPHDLLADAADQAIADLGLRTRVSGVRIPAGFRHYNTLAFALSWDEFDTVDDTYEYDCSVTAAGELHEVKRRHLLDGMVTLFPPTQIDRPDTMVCDTCHGGGRVVLNADAFRCNPQLDERDLRFGDCRSCDGSGRVRRPNPILDPHDDDLDVFADALTPVVADDEPPVF